MLIDDWAVNIEFLGYRTEVIVTIWNGKKGEESLRLATRFPIKYGKPTARQLMSSLENMNDVIQARANK